MDCVSNRTVFLSAPPQVITQPHELGGAGNSGDAMDECWRVRGSWQAIHFLGASFTDMQLGITCRRGPFVEKEIEKINDAIREYQKVRN